MVDEPIKLPVRFKKPPSECEPALKVVYGEKCNHRSFIAADGRLLPVSYLIREGEVEVECGSCRTRLDPMWVLKNLANEESFWSQARARYVEEMKRLGARSATKCQHCGKMTKISRSKAK